MIVFLRKFPLPILFVINLASSAHAETLEGFTEPFRSVDVSIGEPGVITTVAVEPGDTVSAGEPLFSLDTGVLEATLAMARQKAAATGAIDAARSELALRLERSQQIQLLRDRGHATQRELSRAEADAEIARARLKLAEEELALNQLDCRRIEAQIERRHVHSPLDAVVSEVHREVGEAALVTDPRVVTLVQLNQLRVRFPALPSQASQLIDGQVVELSLPDLDCTVPGRIQRIAPVMDAKSGTLEVNVMIENPASRLRSGMRCLLQVPDAAAGASLAVDHRSRS